MSASDLLTILDAERRFRATSDRGAPVREWSSDGSECRIVFAEVEPARTTEIVREERDRARADGYALEWKVYGHDSWPELNATLVSSGFAAGDAETVLGLDLAAIEWDRFIESGHAIRPVRDDAGLADVAAISRQLGRTDVDAETRRLRAMLRDGPDAPTIHVAVDAGEPVSVGRIHYGRTPAVAELAGGRTVATHRGRGLFTAVVRSRLREIATRGRRYVFVDALPTSEPILLKLGFEALTRTRPFTYDPGA